MSFESNKATRINLFSLGTIQMRTFHLSWVSFFLCFFGWFAHIPLMASTIGPDLGLTKAQMITAFMGSVGITILARLYVGYLCDKIGPRLSYVIILVFGAVAVSSSSFAYNWETYFLSRLAIGVIGAGFVITQYHTSVMFAPNVIGIANATTAGWGNLGGGVTQAVMPMIAAAMLALGVADSELSKWRMAMHIPAVIMLLMAFLYWKFTQDCPEGNYKDLRERQSQQKEGESGVFMSAVKDYRVWILFVIYGACFGMELFVNGTAATYYQKRFELPEASAGMIAALYGLMNIFARSLGGWLSDKFAGKIGLGGRVRWLVMVLIAEGAVLMVFSRMEAIELAVISMMLLGIFVQMANGATYSVVPFINKKALGVVAGIVGAGGNLGAVFYAQYFKLSGAPLQDVLLTLGLVVAAIGILGVGIRFSPEAEAEARAAFDKSAAANKA